jgi:hypothetical protein
MLTRTGHVADLTSDVSRRKHCPPPVHETHNGRTDRVSTHAPKQLFNKTETFCDRGIRECQVRIPRPFKGLSRNGSFSLIDSLTTLDSCEVKLPDTVQH